MKTFLFFLPAIIVGLLFWAAAAFLMVTGIKGGHGPGRAQHALHRMHQFVKEDADAGWSIPEPVEFNQHIVKIWELAKEEKEYEELWDLPYAGSLNALTLMEWEWHRFEFYRMSSPPIYVVDDSLADGFGFYLEGRDGVSESGGRDRDDINSWDRSSSGYYSRRIRRGWLIEGIMHGFVVGLAAAGIALIPQGLFCLCRSRAA